ncbi:MAG: PP2C family protein-serine/threonine phosphatase [Acidimicrobiales bacterium]
MISELLQRSSLSAPDLLPADIALTLQSAGSTRASIFLADYELVDLHPLEIGAGLHQHEPDSLPIVGTLAGRCFQLQEVVVSSLPEGGWRVYSPLRERAARIGVLELDFAQVDDALLQLCEDLGRLAGHLLYTASRYTDSIESRRRQRNMSLSAEIQWDMLVPPLSFATRDVAIAGVLEPAYEVAGDGFDYALNGDMLDVVVIDAMGHGLRSSLASALALSAGRHGRRCGLDVVEMAIGIDGAIAAEFDGELFVTGHVGRLDTLTGHFRWVNGGHPDPIHIRGPKVLGPLHIDPCLPFGLGIQISDVGDCNLEPGDSILFYSDGATEARPAGGEQFGEDRLRNRIEQHLGSSAPLDEVLRRVVADVRHHRSDLLQDDVTLVGINWRPDRTS